MRKYLLGLAVCSGLLQAEGRVFITVDQDAVETTRFMSIRGGGIRMLQKADGIAVLEVPESSLDELSHMMHDRHRRCGGYRVHDSEEAARQSLEDAYHYKRLTRQLNPPFVIDQPDLAKAADSRIQTARVRQVIEDMSSMHNRYYKSETGIKASEWVHDLWQGIIKDVPGASVRYVSHKGYPQKSVVVTFAGSDIQDEVVVIGGHLDSIAGFGSSHVHAPGADDNASGIASMTEAMRAIVEIGYKPRRTLEFMAYAAEEVGLRGSGDLAKTYKKEGRKVVGVMQLDMTNYPGSEKDIYIFDDYTNPMLNRFVTDLIETYLTDLSWDYSRCGYACSDHASWTAQGFAATYPSESKMSEDSPFVHTERDTLQNGDASAAHAAKFARLGAVFAVEAAR